jgi:hypothetical protein
LINRGPSVPLGQRLPEEVWSGKEVNLSHLKVFGCVSYVYIESDACSKLDAKSRKCYFIGYGDEAFGYRFWDDQNRKIIRSRNVTFNEMVVYKNNSSAEPVSTKLKVEKLEFINLDGISKGAAQRRNSEVDKDLEQLDVKTAFFHGELEEEIYMQQPQGFIVQGKESLVRKLRRSLYGLKQAPRQWYKKFDSFMCSTRFTRCNADHCCYVKSFKNSYIILLLYVDDMLIARASIEEINKLKN